MDLSQIIDITYPVLSGILIVGAIFTFIVLGSLIVHLSDPDRAPGYFKVGGATLLTYAVIIVSCTYYETYRTFEEKDVVYYNLVSKLDTMSMRDLEKSTIQFHENCQF